MSGEDGGRRPLLIALALVALGLLLHLPGIGRPFGVHEISGGSYFGVFARNFEQLGLWELGGVPVGPVVFDRIDDAQITPYLSHPPGLFWFNAVTGSDEARLRLASALGHIAAALLTFALFRRTLGLWPGAIAGLVTLVFPVLAFYSLVSYESVVLPLGLAMLIAFDRAQGGDARARTRWLVVLGAIAFVGPWMDWQFLFFCAGLAVLALGHWRDMLAKLWLPAVCATLSTGLILAWRARAHAHWAKPGEGGGFPSLLERTVGTRPATGDFLIGFGQRAIECFSSPVVVVALVGVWWLVRRAPRLTAALAVVGAMNAIVFPTHTMTHTLYLAYLAPLVAGATAAAIDRLPRTAGVALAVLVIGVAAWSTLETRRAAATPFFRDLGAELTEAAGTGDERYAVLFNLPYCYGYYVESSRVYSLRVADPQRLEAWRTPELLQLASVRGIRYLWARSETSDGGPVAFPPSDPALDEYLARFPTEAVPALEQDLVVPAADPIGAFLAPSLGARQFRIADARIVTILP